MHRRIRARCAVLLAASLPAGGLSFIPAAAPPQAGTPTPLATTTTTMSTRHRCRTGQRTLPLLMLLLPPPSQTAAVMVAQAAALLRRDDRRRLRRRGDTRRRRGAVSALFVRNIDLPEAIILYDVFGHHGGGAGQNEDWRPLLRQCDECGTAAIVIHCGDGHRDGAATGPSDGKSGAAAARGTGLVTLVARCTVLPPNPKDLLGALGRTVIQPRPFGGSSGFAASRLADPSRPPMASRTVVIGRTELHSLAARYAGMRAVSLDEHDDLADAVLSLEEVQGLWLEDLATPGSFWLNPPHPRDEHGNRVDPERLVSTLENTCTNQESDQATSQLPNDPGPEESLGRKGAEDESEIRRILADLSPL